MSIHTRIFLPFVLALIAGSLIAWWLATTLVADALASRVEDQIERAAAQLASGRLPISQELLDRLGALLGVEFVLIPTTGAADAPAAIVEAAVSVLERSSSGGATRFRRDDSRYSLIVRPIATGLDPRYQALAAATPLTEVELASRRVARLLGAAAVVGTLLLAGVAHLTARGITQPLEQIAALAGRLAGADLRARAHPHGPRELLALARAINEMANRLQRYQREMAERNRLSALGEMAGRVAHEIRNPLTAIKLNVELLAETAGTPTDRATLLNVLREIARLELIVATTLSLGRAPTGELVAVDLNGLVEDVAHLARPHLQHRSIELDCRLQPLTPTTLDGDRLKQVLLNLVNNAAEALPRGGRIRITTEQAPGDGALVLAVEDSGPGIAPAQRTAVFGQGISRKPHGLGVGLRISREIVEQHGGRIWAEASAELGGARLVVRLPGGTGLAHADDEARES